MKKKKLVKRIEVKLPKDMHEQLKLKFGYKLSETMRKHFKEVLAEKDYNYKKFQRCYFCNPKKIIPFSELIVFPLIDKNEEEEDGTITSVCLEHKEWLEHFNLKELQEKARENGDYIPIFAFCYLLSKEGFERGELLKKYAKLCFYFPSKWKLEQAGLIGGKIKDVEELEAQLIKINEKEGLYD